MARDNVYAMDIVGKATAFLVKLWRILHEPAFGHIIFWSADTEITITDIAALECEVLPHYFRSTQFASFQRQLNYFNFAKVGKNSYKHDLFSRSMPAKVLLIKRKQNTGNLKAKNAKKRSLQHQHQQEVETPFKRRRTTQRLRAAH